MAFHFQERRVHKLLLFRRRLPKRSTAHPLLIPKRISVTFSATAMPKTVLIVDDNSPASAPRVTTQRLSKFRSVEAIKKAIAEKPDLIMLDLELPHMEGAKVARILKNHSHAATIPIVGWTGYMDHKRSALSAGMVGCLVKPLSVATIARTLDQFIFSPR